MCLGKLYYEDGSGPLMEDVASFSAEDGQLIFTTLFGEEQSFKGELKQIDFSNSRITIKQGS